MEEWKRQLQAPRTCSDASIPLRALLHHGELKKPLQLFFFFFIKIVYCKYMYGRVFGLNCVCGCFQVRGELPFQKCKAALDSVEFSDKVSDHELASSFADIITQMSQDVSPVNGF